MAKEDLSNFINKATIKSEVQTPKQKVVPIKLGKRNLEDKYTLWIDKELLKDYKIKAVNENTNVKELIVKAMKEYLE